MSKSDREYLLDIVQELDDIAAFTGEGEIAFEHDIKTQKAVLRSYEVIGEICKRVSQDVREQNPQIDWRKLINFRDFLAHNYEIIANRFVWEAVMDGPSLRQKIVEIIENLAS